MEEMTDNEVRAFKDFFRVSKRRRRAEADLLSAPDHHELVGHRVWTACLSTHSLVRVKSSALSLFYIVKFFSWKEHCYLSFMLGKKHGIRGGIVRRGCAGEKKKPVRPNGRTDRAFLRLPSLTIDTLLASLTASSSYSYFSLIQVHVPSSSFFNFICFPLLLLSRLER